MVLRLRRFFSPTIHGDGLGRRGMLEVHSCHFTFPLSFVPCFCHSCHLLMLSLDVFARVIIRTVVLIIPRDVLIYGVRVSLPILTYTITITYLYAWHTSLEHSPPFHLALPAIVTHRHQCILRYLHLVPSPLQMISSSDLYRHYRDSISTRPFTR